MIVEAWEMPPMVSLHNDVWESLLMTRHYPDLSSASDRLKQISHAASQTNQKHYPGHQYRISSGES